MRRAIILTVSAALALGVSGCGGSSKKTKGFSGGGIQIKLTNSGCSPKNLNVPAGPTSFKVSNKNSASVTGFEILASDNTIIGQIENLSPGLDGTFTVTLTPGTFKMTCPGGSNEGELVVTGTASTSTTKPLSAGNNATATYRAYVELEAALLVKGTTRFVGAVDRGDVANAKRLFPTARAHYERIEPIAERFGTLDGLIDGRADEVPRDGSFTGFHRIEQQLWEKGNADGLVGYADALLAYVTQLQDRVASVPLPPELLAAGAIQLLDEIATKKITGEEDRYSHTDLWDFEANLEGAQKAIDSLRPLIAAKDAELPAAIDKQFAATEAALAKYRRGNGYVIYTKLTRADTSALATLVSALAHEVAKVTPLVSST